MLNRKNLKQTEQFEVESNSDSLPVASRFNPSFTKNKRKFSLKKRNRQKNVYIFSESSDSECEQSTNQRTPIVIQIKFEKNKSDKSRGESLQSNNVSAMNLPTSLQIKKRRKTAIRPTNDVELKHQQNWQMNRIKLQHSNSELQKSTDGSQTQEHRKIIEKFVERQTQTEVTPPNRCCPRLPIQMNSGIVWYNYGWHNCHQPYYYLNYEMQKTSGANLSRKPSEKLHSKSMLITSNKPPHCCYHCPSSFLQSSLSKTITAAKSTTDLLATNDQRFARDLHGMVLVDYALVVQHLRSASLTSKANLLQAIRWRITQSSKIIRDQTMQDIINIDLLSLRCDCGIRSLLEDLLWPINALTPHPLQECTARLLNAIVSTKSGRDYVASKSVIQLLVWGENSFEKPFLYTHRQFISPKTADNLIATIMKLSKNQPQRNDMIKKGLLKWLINHMEDVEYSISAYQLKYVSALLLNLLLAIPSPDIAVDNMRQFLALLVRYLQMETPLISKTFLRCCLLVLFKHEQIATYARDMNFSEIILDYCRRSERAERTEFEAIYYSLNNNICSDLTSKRQLSAIASHRIFAEDGSDFDEEIDRNDSVESDLQSLEGEKLLEAKFAVRFTRKSINLQQNIDTKMAIEKNAAIVEEDFNEATMQYQRVPSKREIFPKIGHCCGHTKQIIMKSRIPILKKQTNLVEQNLKLPTIDLEQEDKDFEIITKNLDRKYSALSVSEMSLISKCSEIKTANKSRRLVQSAKLNRNLKIELKRLSSSELSLISTVDCDNRITINLKMQLGLVVKPTKLSKSTSIDALWLTSKSAEQLCRAKSLSNLKINVFKYKDLKTVRSTKIITKCLWKSAPLTRVSEKCEVKRNKSCNNVFPEFKYIETENFIKNTEISAKKNREKLIRIADFRTISRTISLPNTQNSSIASELSRCLSAPSKYPMATDDGAKNMNETTGGLRIEQVSAKLNSSNESTNIEKKLPDSVNEIDTKNTVGQVISSEPTVSLPDEHFFVLEKVDSTDSVKDIDTATENTVDQVIPSEPIVSLLDEHFFVLEKVDFQDSVNEINAAKQSVNEQLPTEPISEAENSAKQAMPSEPSNQVENIADLAIPYSEPRVFVPHEQLFVIEKIDSSSQTDFVLFYYLEPSEKSSKILTFECTHQGTQTEWD